VPARPRRHHTRDARIAPRRQCSLASLRRWSNDLERTRRTRPERPLDCVVARPRVVARRNDLDRRHPGLEREGWQRERPEQHDRREAVGEGPTPETLSPGRGAWRMVLARMDPRKRELVQPRAEL